MDGDLVGKIFGAITAIAVAYNSYMAYRLQKLTMENKRVSEGNAEAIAQVSNRGRENAEALAQVSTLGRENADAIEHTRIQNVRLASAVEVTKAQNDEIVSNVGHLHTCVENRVAEMKEAVERVPEAIREAVPAAIKEVVPDVIKEALPEAVASLK